MNRSKIFLLSFFLILFALAAVANPSSVRAAATLYLSPASKTVNNGENFAVSVYTNTGGDPVNAVQANLSYPTATLQFISVDSSGSAFESYTLLPVLHPNATTPLGLKSFGSRAS